MCPKCARPYLDGESVELSECTKCGNPVERRNGCKYNPLAPFFAGVGKI